MPAQAHAADKYAAALYDAPKYPIDFKHFDYVDPNAPKGGQLRLGVVGSFDSLNPFILRGLAASGLGLMYQTLLDKSSDEPQTGYGHLAESVEIPDDRKWVRFVLRKQARWHDGTPITTDDVVWSFKTLMKKGQPFFRSYYAQVDKVKKIDARTVEFYFKQAGNRELPLIIGDMPVLPKLYWTAEKNDFGKTTLTPPMGSGPYKIKSIEPGRRIIYERVKDWWAKDLPLNKGRYNFDIISFDYYRDPDVAFQAFLSGDIDFRQEYIAKTWAQGYNHPAVKSGKIKKAEIKNGMPTGMQAFAYNIRRPIFQDVRVREALAYAFDFEWSNKQLAFNSYVRTNSYFSNSLLAAIQPISAEEKAILEPFKKDIPERVFTEVYQAPKTNGSGDIRANLRQALVLLRQAGWSLDQGVLKNTKGEAFTFEILNESGVFDRWVLPMIANLKKIGITATLREVDVAQYQNRMNDFDFDVTITTFGQSLTPGNEQLAYWGSESADQPGSPNIIGIKNKVMDALVDKIIHADSYKTLTTTTMAMDRVLQWNFYVIPQWSVNTFRVAYWHSLGRPAVSPPYGLPVIDTWWATGLKSK
jgi:microcin C transport system substrate-binding protein